MVEILVCYMSACSPGVQGQLGFVKLLAFGTWKGQITTVNVALANHE